MKHTKQMYVVVNPQGEPVFSTLDITKPKLMTVDRDLGYTVKPVTVTIELL